MDDELKPVPIICGMDRWSHEFWYGSLNLCLKCRQKAEEMPKKKAEKKITDFLKTKRSKKDLEVALSVLREFKSCESMDEFLGISLGAWAKLEQLEEFLEHLTSGKELRTDTKEYMQEKP